jgi:hypothetical protein
MSTPLPWEEQAISDPNALRTFLKICDEVREDVGSEPTVYYRVASIEQTIKDLTLVLEKRPNEMMWYVGGAEGEEGVHLLAFCGNGIHSPSKAYFIQLALQLLPTFIRNQLDWIETMEDLEVGGVDGVDAIYQLRNTES